MHSIGVFFKGDKSTQPLHKRVSGVSLLGVVLLAIAAISIIGGALALSNATPYLAQQSLFSKVAVLGGGVFLTGIALATIGYDLLKDMCF